jgi:choline dehydrogenase/5-(hydroxymethyl)furfural/furfural oxidase
MRFSDAVREEQLLDTSSFVTDAGPHALPYLRGQGVGGTSAVNAMVQTWGCPDDYNQWERLYGCTGWGWSSVRQEFQNLHMGSSRVTQLGKFSHDVVNAVRRMGAGEVQHGNACADGAGSVALSMVDSKRLDAFSAYVLPLLRDASTADLLDVRTLGKVEAVLLESGVARGVALANGTEEHFDAVVMCAGAIWTPLLLLRSGLYGSAIGRNLQDHPSLSIVVQMAQNVEEVVPEVSSLIIASSAMGESNIHLLPVNAMKNGAGMQFAQLAAAVTKVSSRGLVKEADHRAEISLNSLTTNDDAEAMRAALILASDVLSSVKENGSVVECYVDNEGTRLHELIAHDEASMMKFVRRQLGAYSHVAGTCAMGGKESDRAAVNAGGAVFNTQRLWVADASIFPDIPRAATQLPTMMVASRIARGIAQQLA